MLGGGAGHIADMVARMQTNKKLQLNKRDQRKKQLDLNTSVKNNKPLNFKPTNKKSLDNFKQLLKRNRQRQYFTFTATVLLLLVVLFWLISLIP